MAKKTKKAKATEATRPTEIFLILDRSGSMESIREDVIGGLNSFVEAQAKEPGECRMSALQFDTTYDEILDGVPIGEVPKWTEETFVPRGMTALLDAVYRGIGTLEDRTKDQDVNRVVVVMTDGLENSSQEVSHEALTRKIDEVKAKGWGLIYLGANQDAIQVGSQLGIDPNASATYAANTKGVQGATMYATRAVSDFRMTGQAHSLCATSAERSMMTGSDPDLLKPAEAASYLDVSPSTLRRLKQQGSGPPVTKPSPGKVRYRRQDLRDYLARKSEN